jgi:hypothetical protein
MKFTASKSIKQDISVFEGKPTYLKYILTDDLNNRYEIEMELPKGWDMKEFPHRLKDTFYLCEGMPISIYLIELRLNYQN